MTVRIENQSPLLDSMRQKIETKRDIAVQVVLWTVFSLVVSVVVTSIILIIFSRWHQLTFALIPAVLVPLLAAPTVSYRLCQLQYRLFLQKQTVARLAAEDPLTGLANRRAFFDQAERQFSLSHRHHFKTSFIVVDIDYFKSINDRFGHGVGDRVIVAVANAIKEGSRNTDIVGRLGGEEFGVFLINAGAGDAASTAENMRRQIAKLDFASLNVDVKVTASFGVAENPFAGSVDDLLAAADKKLYEAKRLGRNRVAVGIAEPAAVDTMAKIA
ncbi:GGDEF domain-containing protein [Rhodobium gokarnense]|uniref:diguanylate cyclase n=1 Tax=Rhodobium gokarnense TaxID=364296 RepID=A0ABT3H8Y4_9HYPH|nr:GGDEF domain-containing protein [Rhodobium gokarnense]MCW2306851.1 diguanylate cyclase (GGDEF)-like protein [Rhodobium gokarnense]